MAQQVGRARCWWDGDAHKGTGSGIGWSLLAACSDALRQLKPPPAAVGSLQELEGSKYFLPEPQGAKKGGQEEQRAAAPSPASQVPPLHQALLCPALLRVPLETSPGNFPDLRGYAMKQNPWEEEEEEEEKKRMHCVQETSHCPHPIFASQSCWVLPAVGRHAGRAAVCREHKPVPSNELHGK